MSIIGYLICVADREMIAVGKYVHPNGMAPALLNVTDAETKMVDRAVRRFLAHHLGHSLLVVRDDELHEVPEFETVKYREIGGDEYGDIPLKDYLQHYPE